MPEPLLFLAFNVRCFLRYTRIVRGIQARPISAKSALIVAPHPDDETFGCGGLIALKLAAGVAVRIVLLTDGEAVDNAAGEEKSHIAKCRKIEFIKACEELGLDVGTSLIWLHLPDGKIPHPGQPGFSEAVKLLSAEIEAIVPSEIYCPHLQDVVHDHVAAARMTLAARRISGRVFSVFYYPIWIWYLSSMGLGKRLDLRDAWRLDISSVLAVKHRALAAYLDAPVSANGTPYCGSLPWAFIWSLRRPAEYFFPAAEIDLNVDDPRSS